MTKPVRRIEKRAEAEVEEFWKQPASREIQKEMLEGLRAKGLKDDDDVRRLIQWLREPRIGSKANCGDPEHRPPFELLADVLTGRVSDFLAWANRAGGKTYMAGLMAWATSGFTPKLETTILGGSLEQSEKVYAAMGGFWTLTGLQDEWLAGEPTKKNTLWKNKAKVAVLTASSRSTRGPHPNHVLLDEIDEMDPEVYRAALSQPQSKNGIRASIGKFSTNHRDGGVMDMAVENARASRTPFYKWCIWEALKSCRDHHCSTCKLSRFCPGPHMKDADGYYEPEDLMQKLGELSQTTLEIEWFCRKIGRGDLIYGNEYEEGLHAPEGIPDFNAAYEVFLSIDWGGTHPFSCGAWQKFPELGWVRIDEVYQGNTTNPRFLKECERRPWWRNAKSGVADPSRPDLIREWEAAGIRITPADNEVYSGLEAVRNAMRPVEGPPKFYINRKCRAWLSEVLNYQEKNGRPIKAFDHTMDETRYFTKWKIAGKPARIGKIFMPGILTARRSGFIIKPRPEPPKLGPAPDPGIRLLPQCTVKPPAWDGEDEEGRPSAGERALMIRRKAEGGETAPAPGEGETNGRRKGKIFIR